MNFLYRVVVAWDRTEDTGIADRRYSHSHDMFPFIGQISFSFLPHSSITVNIEIFLIPSYAIISPFVLMSRDVPVAKYCSAHCKVQEITYHTYSPMS